MDGLGPTVVKGKCQLEWEVVVGGYQGDYGFVEQGRGQELGGKFVRLDETMLGLAGWRMFSGQVETAQAGATMAGALQNSAALKFKSLRCGEGALRGILERRCGVGWDVVKGLVHPGYEQLPEAERVYLMLIGFLVYAGLGVEEVFEVVMDAVEVKMRDEVTAEVEEAVCEFLCWVGLFVGMWEAQVGVLAKERAGEVEALGEVREYWWAANWRRRVGFGCRSWVERRFEGARPIMVEKTEKPESQLTPRTGFQRSMSYGIDRSFQNRLSLVAEEKDTLTEEQRRVVETDLRPGELMKIRAFAGTGKTRSLVEYAKARPGKRFLYIAFNASASKDAATKFGSNVTCKSFIQPPSSPS